MKLNRITAAACALCVMLCACGNSTTQKLPKPQPAKALKGEAVNSVVGTPGKADFTYSSDAEMLADMTLGCKNEKFSLYYNQNNLATALVDNATGEIFTSNPCNAALDPYFSGDVAKKLTSQVIVSYYNSDNACFSLYSSSDCAEFGQYSIKTFSNGLRFDLSLGEEKGNLLNPEVFTKQEYETLLSKMQGRDAGRFESYYMYIDLKQVTDTNRKKDLEKSYPIIKKMPLYVRTELNDKEKAQLDAALTKAGYTKKAYREAVEKYGLTEKEEIYPNFKLSLEYRLTNDGMCVTVPQDSLSFDSGFSLASITVLPYFAADSEQSGNGGYLFIPDGSGSIININGQDPQRRRLISNRVYGYDSALNQAKDMNSGGMQYYLPTFGIKRNNGTAVAAIIEKGDEMSEITASLGAPNSNYYTVYNTFMYSAGELVLREQKVASLSSARPVYLSDKNLSYSDYTVSYHLLSGDKASYSGMAEVYRDYLMKNGMKENKGTKTHIGIETVGSALYHTSFLGFGYDTNAVFTTYSQNKNILEYFKNKGITNLSLTLKGWQDRGMDCLITNKLRFSGVLGGKSKFRNLESYCKNSGIAFYPLVDFAYSGNDASNDGFSRKTDAARQLSRSYAELAVYNPATGEYDRPKNVLSPLRYEKFFNSLTDSCRANKVKTLSLDSLGTKLNSDFDEDSSINRTQTKLTLTALLDKNKDVKLSFVGANAYVLPYAAMLSDIPLTDSGYPGESAAVPFLQLVISGCADYESSAINLMNDSKTQLLYCIASGTSPKFMLAYDNIEKLKLTAYTDYYAISFDVLKKDIAKYGSYVNKALSVTNGTKLKSHELLADGVTVSYFGNGAAIYVNTSDTDYVADGITVKAKNYRAVKGERVK